MLWCALLCQRKSSFSAFVYSVGVLKTLTSDSLTLAEPLGAPTPRSSILEETKEEVEEPPNLEDSYMLRSQKRKWTFLRLRTLRVSPGEATPTSVSQCPLFLHGTSWPRHSLPGSVFTCLYMVPVSMREHVPVIQSPSQEATTVPPLAQQSIFSCIAWWDSYFLFSIFPLISWVGS